MMPTANWWEDFFTGLIVDFETEGEFPLFGNNDNRVDYMASWLVSTFMSKLRKHPTYRHALHTQSVLTCNREYGLHVAGLSIKMHRDDGAGAFGDSFFQQVGVEIVGVRQNINKNGCCANVGDGKGSGNIRVWNSNYFISRAYIKCCQRQVQRIDA